MQNISSAAFKDTKPHYELLDGLRGVAALLVVFYHIFEGLSFAAGGTVITIINHGYLAVDFFFMLSGFVISYAYDNRWGKSLTTRNFFKRRLIRLHPMIVMGAVVGLIAFLIQGGVKWDGTHVPVTMAIPALVCTFLFIPAIPGSCYEIRGNGEMFPLNGPFWSLFFEYIGNILYALFIRKLSDRQLSILVICLGIVLTWFALSDVIGYGMIGVGWTLDSLNSFGGLTRMLFPFTLGMLLSRKFHSFKISGAFWICTIVLIILFCIPYIEGKSHICMNGLFEIACIALIFPVLIRIGAAGKTTDKLSTSICKFLGDISYPLYAIHYPVMYVFYAWLIDNKLYTFGEIWQVAVIIYIGCILLAYSCLRLYDEPVRKWLSSKAV